MAYGETSEPLPAGDPEHAVEAAKSKLEGRKRFLEESLSETERKFRAANAHPDAVAEAESKVRDLEAGIRFGERVHLDALGGAAEISALLSHVGSHPSLNRGISVPVRLSDAFDTETVAKPVELGLCRLLGRKPEDLFHVPEFASMKRFDTGSNPPREITAAYLRTLLADPLHSEAYSWITVTAPGWDSVTDIRFPKAVSSGSGIDMVIPVDARKLPPGTGTITVVPKCKDPEAKVECDIHGSEMRIQYIKPASLKFVGIDASWDDTNGKGDGVDLDGIFQTLKALDVPVRSMYSWKAFQNGGKAVLFYN